MTFQNGNLVRFTAAYLAAPFGNKSLTGTYRVISTADSKGRVLIATGETESRFAYPDWIESVDRWINGHVERRVDALRVGDRVDLEGDCFADPCGGAADSAEMADSEHPEFAFEFETVAAIERETADCIRVDFESGFSCGFPPDHWIDVDGEQTRESAA